jgi:hypothetical protein
MMNVRNRSSMERAVTVLMMLAMVFIVGFMVGGSCYAFKRGTSQDATTEAVREAR